MGTKLSARVTMVFLSFAAGKTSKHFSTDGNGRRRLPSKEFRDETRRFGEIYSVFDKFPIAWNHPLQPRVCRRSASVCHPWP